MLKRGPCIGFAVCVLVLFVVNGLGNTCVSGFYKKNRNFKNRNSKTEIQSEIIKIKIIEIQA